MGITKSSPFKPKDSSGGRFWGIQTIRGSDTPETFETPYMTRIWFGRLRVHIFHRGDADPDCHDHPWGFWTFPLRSYVEEFVTETRCLTCGMSLGACGLCLDSPEFTQHLHVVSAWRWHYRPAIHCHRVLGSYEGMEPNDASYFWPHGVAPRTVPRIGGRRIITVVWREPASREWGFTKKRLSKWCWVPWKTYVYEGGKDAPCGD